VDRFWEATASGELKPSQNQKKVMDQQVIIFTKLAVVRMVQPAL